jgi:predicted metalloprotease with PDZ domain
MKRSCVLLACLAALAGGARAHSQAKIAYTFTPELTGSVPVLHVDLVFQGNSAGDSTLILPTTWAGQRDLYKSILKLRSVDPECILMPQADPGSVLLKYPPNRKVRVAYDLVSDWSGALRHPKEFRAVVQKTRVIFNGQNGLAHPELAQNAIVRVNFIWKSLPENWVVASSFGSQRTHQKFSGEWHEVHDALFAAGDFRITQITRAGEKLTLAVRGSWVFSDEEAANQIAEIFHVEREFWGERKRDSFLVVLAPYDQDLGSSDGSVFTHAFLLYLSRQQTFLTEVKSLLAHEVFHTWNPYRMGLPSGESTYWFTEGFTRYYQDRILLQAGLVDLPEYLERLNRIVADYWNSPDRNWTEKQWLERSSTHPAEYDLPYSRGAMIALWLDDRLRKNSARRSSLDERMFSLVKDHPEVLLTTDYLLSILSLGLSSQEAADLHSFVESGVTIPLPHEVPSDCGNLIQEGDSTPRYIPAQGRCTALVSRLAR